MKNLRLLQILFLSLVIFSCDSEDDSNGSPVQEQGIVATIDGGTYNNYSFTDGVYSVTKGSTISIEAADSNGDNLTLFLNGTGGFSKGTVKQMGDNDSNNFKTYVLIRQQETQLSYFALETGNITITNNRKHPTESGIRLISGTFSVTATSTVDNHTATMNGTFTELEYNDSQQ